MIRRKSAFWTLVSTAMTLNVWPGALVVAQVTTSDTGLQLEEVVVTAQKRAENLQDIPVSVTALSGKDLEIRGATGIMDLPTLTSGLELQLGGGIFAPFLRGIGNSANAVGNESSIALYVDGVYFSRLPPGFFSLADIDQVEVLKGPQGTLFGRNASGGVIQIITPDPSHNAAVRGHLGYGSFNTLQGDVYATGGLGDKVAADIAVSGTKQFDGYGTNIATGHRVGYQDDVTIRSKVLIEPTDATRILLTGFYTYSKSSQQGNTYPGTTQGFLSAPFDLEPPLNFHDQRTDLDSYALSESWGSSLKVDHDFGVVKFVSITAYMDETEHNLYDIDYGPRPDVRADLFSRVSQFTQEFQLSNSKVDKLSWTVGLYYYNTLSRYNPLLFQGPAFIPGDVLGDNLLNAIHIVGQQRAESYAGFAQATYEILPKLKLTSGIRYTDDYLGGRGQTNIIADNVTVFTGPVTTGTDKTTKPTFKEAVSYEFVPDVTGYVSFSRGYKSATYTLLPFTPPATKPEVLDAYEVGVKSELLDRRLRLNVAAFRYSVKNPQVQLLNGGSVTNSNAGSSRVKGLEMEGNVAVTDGLRLNFGATYLDAIYTEYLGAPDGPVLFSPPYGAPSPLLSVNASGNRLPLAPRFDGTLGAQYTVKSSIGEWTGVADYNYNSGFFWEPDNLLRQKAYNIVNARLNYRPNDRFSVALWTKNLLDVKYAAFAATQAGPAGYPYIAAAPRTYGVTFGFGF